MNKTQFKQFENEVKANFKALCLPWEVKVCVGEVDTSTAICEAEWDRNNRLALITFNKKHASKLNTPILKRTALHETLEILMAPLRDMLNKYYSWEHADEQIHIIIRSLENAMLKS